MTHCTLHIAHCRFLKSFFTFFALMTFLTPSGVRAEGMNDQQLVEKILKSVVYISREGSIGSGFIIDPSGYILTNHHVVEKSTAENPNEVAERIVVTLFDDQKYSAKVIGHFVSPDCALLKIEVKKPLPFLILGDSTKVKAGEKVYTLGQPHGLQKTVTSGIVSNARRGGAGAVPVIQTDAPINPGNSGGPLVDDRGEVVGINTYKGQGEALGYAVPINYVKVLKEHFLKHGEFQRSIVPWVFFESVSDRTEKFLGISGGAVVSFSKPGSVGFVSGWRMGDVVTSIGEHAVSTKEPEDEQEFQWFLMSQPVGTTLKSKGIRQTGGSWTPVTFDMAFSAQERPLAELPELTIEDLKVGVKTLTTFAKIQLNDLPVDGVLMSRVGPGTIFDEAGIQANDIVLTVQKTPVKTAQEFERALQEVLGRKDEFVWFSVYRRPDAIEVVAKPAYPLKDMEVALVLPPSKADESLMKIAQDRLVRQGAKVTVVRTTGKNADLTTLNLQKLTGAILLDGEGWESMEAQETMKQLVAEMSKKKHVLAGVGQAPVLFLKADKKLASKRITFQLEGLERVKNLDPNWTNSSVEEDDGLVTARSESEKTFKSFVDRTISALIRSKSL